jgi:hypothetical protein
LETSWLGILLGLSTANPSAGIHRFIVALCPATDLRHSRHRQERDVETKGYAFILMLSDSNNAHPERMGVGWKVTADWQSNLILWGSSEVEGAARSSLHTPLLPLFGLDIAAAQTLESASNGSTPSTYQLVRAPNCARFEQCC